MREAWVQLHCRKCDKRWQKNPKELPAPSESFACPACGLDDSMSTFLETARGLEILEHFHSA